MTANYQLPGTASMTSPQNEINILAVLGAGILVTQREISQKTGLPKNAVRYAIRKLTAGGNLVTHFNIRDARSPLYSLKTPHQLVEAPA